MASRRDTGQSAVYRSEDIVAAIIEDGGTVTLFGQFFDLPNGQRLFGRVEDIERYLDALWEMSWVREFGVERPRLRTRKGDRKAVYHSRDHTIAIPESDWALTEMVVLHEVAHSLTKGDGHGPHFRRVYAFLTSRAMHPVMGMLLNYHFDQDLG